MKKKRVHWPEGVVESVSKRRKLLFLDEISPRMHILKDNLSQYLKDKSWVSIQSMWDQLEKNHELGRFLAFINYAPFYELLEFKDLIGWKALFQTLPPRQQFLALIYSNDLLLQHLLHVSIEILEQSPNRKSEIFVLLNKILETAPQCIQDKITFHLEEILSAYSSFDEKRKIEAFKEIWNEFITHFSFDDNAKKKELFLTLKKPKFSPEAETFIQVFDLYLKYQSWAGLQRSFSILEKKNELESFLEHIRYAPFKKALEKKDIVFFKALIHTLPKKFQSSILLCNQAILLNHFISISIENVKNGVYQSTSTTEILKFLISLSPTKIAHSIKNIIETYIQKNIHEIQPIQNDFSLLFNSITSEKTTESFPLCLNHH